MLEETLRVENSLSPRKQACMRQCRVLRHKLNQDGGCPCDVLAECRFVPSDKDDIWFADNWNFWKQLSEE